MMMLLGGSLGGNWAYLLAQKERICLQVRRPGSIPGFRKSPGEGNGYPLQYACLENSMDRETWKATVHGLTNSQTRLKD